MYRINIVSVCLTCYMRYLLYEEMSVKHVFPSPLNIHYTVQKPLIWAVYIMGSKLGNEIGF